MTIEPEATDAEVPLWSEGVLKSRPAGFRGPVHRTSRPVVSSKEFGTVFEMLDAIVVALQSTSPAHEAMATELLKAWGAEHPLGMAAIAFGPAHDLPAHRITELAEQRIHVVRNPGCSAVEQAKGFLADIRRMDAQT